MNFFCQPPKYLLGESFIEFLASFESFCESVEAPDAAKRHAFLASLPEIMKFEMQEADKQLYELSYDALKRKATKEACGAKQSNRARQQLISRCQAIGESNQSYVTALHQLGEIAYLDMEDAQTKNVVLYNVLISGLKDKHLVDRLMARNSQADRPRCLDTAKRLLALNTNTLPDDSAALSAIRLQKSVNQKNEIEELKGLITDLRKEVQDIRDMCIKQRSTPVTFAEKVDIFKGIAQKNGSNLAAIEKWIATLTEQMHETNRRKMFIMCRQSAMNFVNMLRLL